MVVQAPRVLVGWTAGHRQQVLRWESHLALAQEEVLVEEQERPAELVEVLVEGEEAPG